MKRMDEYNCGDCARFYSVDEWNGECSKHGCVSCMSKICKDFILNDMIKEDEGEMKYYWFTFADGYSVCVRGFSKQELKVEESKHGKLLRRVEA